VAIKPRPLIYKAIRGKAQRSRNRRRPEKTEEHGSGAPRCRSQARRMGVAALVEIEGFPEVE
jgi:hypothetical protein